VKKYRYVESGYVVTDSPRYEHDCTSCIFLGQSGKADLYACQVRGRVDTVIARYSDEGSDYSSGILFADKEGPINEAFERALGMRMIPRWWPDAYKKEVFESDGNYGTTFYVKFSCFPHCMEEPYPGTPSAEVIGRKFYLAMNAVDFVTTKL